MTMIKRYFPYSSLRQDYATGRLTAFVLATSYALAWLFFRLELPNWRAILNNRRYWFPHLNPEQPRLLDPLRYTVQLGYLLLVRDRPNRPALRIRVFVRKIKRMAIALHRLWRRKLQQAPKRLLRSEVAASGQRRWLTLTERQQRGLNTLLVLIALGLMAFTVTQPLDYGAQFVFVLLLWAIAVSIRHIPGRFPSLVLIVLSTIVASRYLWWRYTATLNWNDSLDLSLGLTLLAAETYAWIILMLGYFQTSWPLSRKPVALPKDMADWPSVDLFIPTYNEPLSVIITTVYAAKGIDWPKDKLNIYMLDDGRRDEFRDFAHRAGIHYITRDNNQHAKAGNLNNALGQTHSELVAIFDCDHIPVRSFLQMTVGWFTVDPKMALVQTPHHFLSPDPFERNLNLFRRNPNEGELFYGLVQAGNDTWNAAFFCGSCAVLRRTALESIGGFAVETVTEDAHTALRMHRKGWKSAYLGIPQAAGLATESLSAHIGQRIRWARGMVQIFRTDNPLTGKGLSLFQRLCYANAMLHFMAGLPRIVFLLAPLAFLLLHSYIIYASPLMLVLFVFPYMIHSTLTSARLQGKHRKSFWGEVYETVLAWYIARPTTIALFSPKKGTFNVTEKGGLIDTEVFDWKIARPYLALAALNFAGLVYGVWRLFYGPADEVGTVIITSLWVMYNLLIIGAAVAVAAESKQVRQSHRVSFHLPIVIRLPNGHLYPATLQDYSEGGAGLQLEETLSLAAGDTLQLLISRGEQQFCFPATVTRSQPHALGVYFPNFSEQQHIDFVQCTYARADAWLNWLDTEEDRPLQSMLDVLRVGLTGYARLYQFLPNWIRQALAPVLRGCSWVASFIPRPPNTHYLTPTFIDEQRQVPL